MNKGDRIIIGADHAGFDAKEEMKVFLKKKGYFVDDMSSGKVEGDDYPDRAFNVAEKVAKTGGKGILFCGTGTGMAIAANKVNGIRAVVGYNEEAAKMSRMHNDTNVLALGGWEVKPEKMKRIISVWLKTPFSREARHRRRIGKIADYDSK